jgi:hypothetical protein
VGNSNPNMASGGHITFTANGNMISGTLQASSLRIKKLHDVPSACWARKGGPRSRVYCEVYAHIEHRQHCGRGPSGKWFNWDAG